MCRFAKYSINRQPSAVLICENCTGNLNPLTLNIFIIKKLLN